MGDPTEASSPSRFDERYTLDPAFYPTYEQKPRLRLLDKKLQLDPELEFRIALLHADLDREDVLDRLLRPNWKLLEPSWSLYLVRPDPFALTTSVPAIQTPAYKPGKGPDTPKPAEMSDLLGAISKMPQVQSLVGKARDHAKREVSLLERDWHAAKTPEKIAMVSVGTIVAGSMVGMVLAAKPTRELTLKFLDGRDIPMPVDGFSLRLQVPDEDKKRGWGVGITAPLGVSGLSARGHWQARDGAGPDLGVNLTFDIAEFWRSRQKARSGK
jgi:hypothetical protein